ncbi:MAG: hypothetical protein ACE5G7_00890 [Candidatus Hydrothermarchaeaceae archaeon]
MTRETASKFGSSSNPTEDGSATPSALFTRLIAVKEIVEGTAEMNGNDLNHTEGLPGILKPNFLMPKLSKEKQKEGFE